LFFSGTFSTLNLFGAGFAFAFAFGVFAIILHRHPELNSTERDKKKMLQCDAFPGKS